MASVNTVCEWKVSFSPTSIGARLVTRPMSYPADAARASVNVSLDPELLTRLAARIGTGQTLRTHASIDLSSRRPQHPTSVRAAPRTSRRRSPVCRPTP